LGRAEGVRGEELGVRSEAAASYESVTTLESRVMPGVRFTIARMSFDRRVELMRRIRELARRAEFLGAGQSAEDKMDAALVQAEIERLYVSWGLRGVSGLVIDGREANPETLSGDAPEDLFREALAAVRAETGLTEEQRKNC
jgi:hypothetical protein